MRQFIQEIDFSENIEMDNYFNDSSLYDLARLFKAAMDNRPVISQFELVKEPIKLEEQKEMIKKYFDGEGKIIFNNLIKIFKVKNGNHCDIFSSSRLGKGRYLYYQINPMFTHQIELINLQMKS